MHFQASQISDLKRFGQQLSDVFQMSEERIRTSVAFPTEDFISVDGEIVE